MAAFKDSSDGGNTSLSDFIVNNASILVVLLVMLLMVASLYCVDRAWNRMQRDLEKATGVMKQSYEFTLNLVTHFMPSFAVEKYQFRGMQPKSATMDIAFQDLGLELPGGSRVLKGVTGEFKAGRMCAIMGPSGAGKTTFMNVLCGKATYGKMSGSISVNGKEAQISDFKSVIGFVPQDDIVHEELTVREQIQFAAKLRNRVGTTEKQIQSITDDVLNVLQVEHIQNKIVGGVESRGISGGQRKRVNIGTELASQPTVLFLDEPTSGLDSTSSLSVALSLKKMCQLGMTSIMVIHQPRYTLFTLFDDVLLLGKGGQTVYLGPSLGVKPYFESLGFEMPPDENPADWFMDVISGEVPTSLYPDFKPQMLFQLWEERGRFIEDEQQLRERSLTRTLSMREDKSILEAKLEEEWNIIDTNRDGALQECELRALLERCSGIDPDDQVVGEIFKRMAGDEAKVVSKEEFVDYLSSLRGSVVAKDRQTSSSGELMSCSSSFTSSSISPKDLETGAHVDVGLQRVTPGFFLQLQILFHRRLVQWWRKNRQRALFCLVLSLGAIVLAVMDRFLSPVPRWDAGSFLYSHSALSLLISIFCLQVFNNDRPVFWRESSRGLHVMAFFIARVCMNTFDLFIQTFLFTALYYLIRQPGVPFWLYMFPFLLVTFTASGWGYLISTFAPPQHGPFVASIVVFIVCCVLGDPIHMADFLDGGVFQLIVSMFSITRWSVGMCVDYQVEYTNPQPLTAADQEALQAQNIVYNKGMWSIGYWWTCTIALIIQGTVLWMLASAGLRFRNRDKQA